MSAEHKKRVQQALERNHKKLLDEQNHVPRRNKKPEKEVEEQCLKWMRAQGWEVQIIESRAVYNPRAGTYTQNQSVKTGNADCQGIMPDGISVAIEFKAKGKLSSFLRNGNERQRDFLIKRIHMNGFAAVVDSCELLQSIYDEWQAARAVSQEAAKHYLLTQLPVRKRGDGTTNSDNELFEE